MNDQRVNRNDLAVWIVRSLDGSITVEERQQMGTLLRDNKAARYYYMEFLATYLKLKKNRGITEVMSLPMELTDKLGFMDIVEKDLDDSVIRRAIKQEVNNELSEKELQQNFALQRKRPTRRQVFLGLVNMAAILFFGLALIGLDRWLMRESAVHTREVVARLEDEIGAKWDTYLRMPRENGAMVQDHYGLKSGLAKIHFNNGAQVVIEGPAQWTLQSEDTMYLSYGKIYSTVPVEARGFTVKTSRSKFIDLGTEFGLEERVNGNLELHVLKGKVMMLTGQNKKTSKFETITSGNAVEMNGEEMKTKPIPIQENLFIRDLSSGVNRYWRSPVSIDLADIYGNGDGYGSGQLNQWTDLCNGQIGSRFSRKNGPLNSQSDHLYHEISNILGVDGVFSPDGENGPVQVSSAGHFWKNCPNTSGIFYENIYNGHEMPGIYAHNLIANGQNYGTREHPALALHTNAGITFDLKTIRRTLARYEIVRFRASCGITEDALKYDQFKPQEDFWVLVDGQERKSIKNVTPEQGLLEIAVELKPEDRFLTLVSTDSDLSVSNDWGFFAEPRLELE